MEKDNIIECSTTTVIHKEIVDKVISSMPDFSSVQAVTFFLKAISDETRIRIICALNINEMCVCDLSAVLDMTKSAISHQLRTLRDASIVKNRRDGKVVFYSLSDDHVKQIIETSLVHVSE